jgi:23S rRNA (pseudouridine1915-N3)-methyltransferase
LYETYARRLAWPVTLREFEEKRRLPPAELKIRESALLLEAVPRNAMAVVLDETGHALSSEAFAGRLGRWRDDGRAAVAFVIGGADGLTEEVRTRADLLLAFGPQTWPHMLVRAMLMEQIYRAQQILAGHPYHRG